MTFRTTIELPAVLIMEALYDTQRTTARKLAKELPKPAEEANTLTLRPRLKEIGEEGHDESLTLTALGSLREEMLSSSAYGEGASVTSQWSATTTQGLTSAIGAVRALRNPFAEVREREGGRGAYCTSLAKGCDRCPAAIA